VFFEIQNPCKILSLGVLFFEQNKKEIFFFWRIGFWGFTQRIFFIKGRSFVFLNLNAHFKIFFGKIFGEIYFSSLIFMASDIVSFFFKKSKQDLCEFFLSNFYVSKGQTKNVIPNRGEDFWVLGFFDLIFSFSGFRTRKFQSFSHSS